jgi:hypothetical protein
LVSGIKTFALIVILGSIAVVADHAFFVAPRASVQRVNDAAPAITAPSASGAFVVTEHQRTNERDVPEHSSAF